MIGLSRSLARWPAYAPDARDLRVVRVAGLDLPARATVALAVTVVVLLFDFSRTFIPSPILELYRAPAAMRYQALERVVLFGLVPLLVVVLAFRDRPSRYGLTLGDWRWGLALAVLGCAVMTPVVLFLATRPDFRDFYALNATDVPNLVTTEILDLTPSEFLFRGFLMFTLLRVIGPLGIVVSTLPFVFIHLGKPELELFSTFGGGLVFGWLDWRTGSIAWSALAHVYIQVLAIGLSAPG